MRVVDETWKQEFADVAQACDVSLAMITRRLASARRGSPEEP